MKHENKKNKIRNKENRNDRVRAFLIFPLAIS
jgi:hypothetical protein